MKKLLLSILVAFTAFHAYSQPIPPSTIAAMRAIVNSQFTTATGFHVITAPIEGHALDTIWGAVNALNNAIATTGSLQAVLNAGNSADATAGSNSIGLTQVDVDQSVLFFNPLILQFENPSGLVVTRLANDGSLSLKNTPYTYAAKLESWPGLSNSQTIFIGGEATATGGFPSLVVLHQTEYPLNISRIGSAWYRDNSMSISNIPYLDSLGSGMLLLTNIIDTVQLNYQRMQFSNGGSASASYGIGGWNITHGAAYLTGSADSVYLNDGAGSTVNIQPATTVLKTGGFTFSLAGNTATMTQGSNFLSYSAGQGYAVQNASVAMAMAANSISNQNLSSGFTTTINFLTPSTNRTQSFQNESGAILTSADTGTIGFGGNGQFLVTNTYYANTPLPAKAFANLTGQTSDGTIASYTTTNIGTFSIAPYINIIAIATDIIEVEMQWTDEASNVRTQVFYPMGTTTASLPNVAFTAFPSATIRVKAGSTITVLTHLITSTGSITFNAGATIQQTN